MTSNSGNDVACNDFKKLIAECAKPVDNSSDFHNHFVIKKRNRCNPEFPDCHSSNFRNILSYFQSAGSSPTSCYPAVNTNNETIISTPSSHTSVESNESLRGYGNFKPIAVNGSQHFSTTSREDGRFVTQHNAISEDQDSNSDSFPKFKLRQEEHKLTDVIHNAPNLIGEYEDKRNVYKHDKTENFDIWLSNRISSKLSHTSSLLTPSLNQIEKANSKDCLPLKTESESVPPVIDHSLTERTMYKTEQNQKSASGSGDLISGRSRSIIIQQTNAPEGPTKENSSVSSMSMSTNLLNQPNAQDGKQRPATAVASFKSPFLIPGLNSKVSRPVTADPLLPCSRMQGLIHKVGRISSEEKLPCLDTNNEQDNSPMSQFYPPITKYVRGLDSCRQANGKDFVDEKLVLKACNQKQPIPMELIFGRLSNLEKVGEGVYGEVFVGHFGEKNETCRVYKIVPIEGQDLVNGERPKKYREILPEIIISKQLTQLHVGYRRCVTDGFVKMHHARIAKGLYPQSLVEKWQEWDEENKSDNDCPQFPNNQLYLVFEFDHAGHDVECFIFKNSKQSFFITLQIAHILAVGEVAMEFEHRDLHWGNILVQQTNALNITYKFNGKNKFLPSYGVKACIIDFTMARAINNTSTPVYLDMKDDEEQFLGTGDHQFDIYRMMRDINRNEWEPFYPKTNTFWVHYLAEKLAVCARYLDTESLEHRYYIAQLKSLKDGILNFDSCSQFVYSQTCEILKTL